MKLQITQPSGLLQVLKKVFWHCVNLCAKFPVAVIPHVDSIIAEQSANDSMSVILTASVCKYGIVNTASLYIHVIACDIFENVCHNGSFPTHGGQLSLRGFISRTSTTEGTRALWLNNIVVHTAGFEPVHQP
jgi:hypothetical protein